MFRSATTTSGPPSSYLPQRRTISPLIRERPAVSQKRGSLTSTCSQRIPYVGQARATSIHRSLTRRSSLPRHEPPIPRERQSPPPSFANERSHPSPPGLRTQQNPPDGRISPPHPYPIHHHTPRSPSSGSKAPKNATASAPKFTPPIHYCTFPSSPPPTWLNYSPDSISYARYHQCYEIPHWDVPSAVTLKRIAAQSLHTLTQDIPLIPPGTRLDGIPPSLAFAVMIVGSPRHSAVAGDFSRTVPGMRHFLAVLDEQEWQEGRSVLPPGNGVSAGEPSDEEIAFESKKPVRLGSVLPD